MTIKTIDRVCVYILIIVLIVLKDYNQDLRYIMDDLDNFFGDDAADAFVAGIKFDMVGDD